MMKARPMLGALPFGPIACCQYNPIIKGYTCYDNAGNVVYNQAGDVPPVDTECTKVGALEDYPELRKGPQPLPAPRPATVIPGRAGGPPRIIETEPGWASAVAPYVTYAVANVAFGDMQPPPYSPATLVEQDQPLTPAKPVPPGPPPPSSGPLPASDWFGMFRRR